MANNVGHVGIIRKVWFLELTMYQTNVILIDILFSS